MKSFRIKVDDVIYTVQQNAKGYSISQNEKELFVLMATVGRNLSFHWRTEQGHKSHLIDKIGLVIEHHGLDHYL
jgi:hypothetical protein